MTVAVSVFEWTKLLRYVRIGRTPKLVGLMLATYANPDGTEAYPGVARLAVACGLDYKTVKRALADLSAAGLVMKVDQHSGTRGRYDVYYLTLPDPVWDTVEVLTPDEFNNDVERVRQANRRKPGTGNGSPRTKREVRGTADPVPSPVSGPAPEAVRGLSVPQNGEVRGLSVPQYGDFPSAVPIPTPEPSSTYPSLPQNLPTAVTVTREAAADQEPDFAEKKTPHLRLVPDDEPRPTPTRGYGFCVPCHVAGRVTLAADPVDGSACDYHLRAEAS